ncbi:MAG: prepilin-type N-terminal cleavage/methylation domain-containing protein [Candidatus Saccharimonadales bacterium]
MKDNIHNIKKTAQAGFTIVELMIATLVFSVILLIITIGVLHFSNAYYKGINSSTTQNTARNIVDSVAQAIQFGGGQVAVPAGMSFANTTTYCVGNTVQFDFSLGQQLGPGKDTLAALYESPNANGGCVAISSPANFKVGKNSSGALLSGGKELLGNTMRLSKFSITPVTIPGSSDQDTYTIDVRVVYGDTDLLTNPTGPNAKCIDQVGSQFCAVSELITTVQTRVNPKP